jgi:hypothetical protein
MMEEGEMEMEGKVRRDRRPGDVVDTELKWNGSKRWE